MRLLVETPPLSPLNDVWEVSFKNISIREKLYRTTVIPLTSFAQYFANPLLMPASWELNLRLLLVPPQPRFVVLLGRKSFFESGKILLQPVSRENY